MPRPSFAPLWIAGRTKPAWLAVLAFACQAAVLANLGAVEAGAPRVSFRTQVMPVLSKAGCNLGTCHGNAFGKAGFKLSLRGQDPDLDHLALTRDMFGRRVNFQSPEESLILLKATTLISHEGGRRFDGESEAYRTLATWIGQGAVDDADAAPRLIRLEVEPTRRILEGEPFEVALQARAVFSNGERRDVTRLAVYEPSSTYVAVTPDGRAIGERAGEVTVAVRFLQEQIPVRLAFVPARPDFVWTDPPAANFIDAINFAKLRALKINPSEPIDDVTFLRRAHWDLLGLPPTAEEARAFVEDSDGGKRARKIDALLEREEFADFWALKWGDLLRNEEKSLDRKGVQTFHRWIRRSLMEGKPLDRFVRELITARGSTYQEPPANYYRALRTPIDRAEATAQLFLGTRLQCAKCHNHPFDRWTQDDYYDWANLFARVRYKVLDNKKRDRLDSHEFVGEQIVWIDREGAVTNPKTGQAAASRFLDMSDMTPNSDSSEAEPWTHPGPAPEDDPLTALATWLTSPDNPLFARSQVNWVWYHLIGRGLVDPIDDFRATNPPSNPELLDALAQDFIAHGFDLRHAARRIMNSRTYQLSSVPNETNRDDNANASRGVVRRLTAEQLLDAQCQVLGTAAAFDGYPRGMRAGQLPALNAVNRRNRVKDSADQFLLLFGKPERLLACECERSDETTLSQAFQLISGPTVNELLSDPNNRLARLAESDRTDEASVRELFWDTLSRAPTAGELSESLASIAAAGRRRDALEDLAWALLNAKEFILRH